MQTPAVDYNLTPQIVIWEPTRACDLACYHCRAAAQPRRSSFELSTYEGYKLIDQVADLKPRVFVITGGDPLKRDDIYQFIDYARRRGLDPAITPSATPLLTEAAIERMKRNGLGRISLSLDGSSAQVHDSWRGVPGAFDLTMRAIRKAAEQNLPVQINTIVTRRNLADLPALARLVGGIGAVAWMFFFPVPAGRAKSPDLLTAEEMESTFAFLYEVAEKMPLEVSTNEAMHYRRYAVQRRIEERNRDIEGLFNDETGLIEPTADMLARFDRGIPANVPQDGVPSAPRGVNEGRGFVFISHIGEVYPSGFLPMSAGNVRYQSLGQIYLHSPLFVNLRDTAQLKGRCGACEFRELCGGSRARAFAMTGDVFASDPLCTYQPGTVLRHAPAGV